MIKFIAAIAAGLVAVGVLGADTTARAGSGDCIKCILQNCDFECDGIGDNCLSCIGRKCTGIMECR